MFFQKTTWQLLWRFALKKDGLVLRLQKNFRIRNGTTEKSISIKSTKNRVYIIYIIQRFWATRYDCIYISIKTHLHITKCHERSEVVTVYRRKSNSAT